jgi:hypothetical protein
VLHPQQLAPALVELVVADAGDVDLRSLRSRVARYAAPPAGVLLILPPELVEGFGSRLPWKSLIASRSSLMKSFFLDLASWL